MVGSQVYTQGRGGVCDPEVERAAWVAGCVISGAVELWSFRHTCFARMTPRMRSPETKFSTCFMV